MKLPLALSLLTVLALSAPAHAEEWTTTASGLKYQVLQAGAEGTEPHAADLVEVHYTGTFEDGRTFDSSRKPGRTSFRFPLGRGQVIPGWDEGVGLMTVGSRYRFFVPWALAYGEVGRPPKIPAKTNLLFDVELLSVRRAPPFVKPDPAQQQTTASGLKYEVLAAGEGSTPLPTQGVAMAFAIWNTKGELLVASELVGKTMAGAIEALPGMQLGPTKPAFIKEAALMMKPGARYRFEVPPALCWGAVAAGPELPANSVTIWEFTMQSIHDVPAFEPGDPAARQETPSGLQYEVLRAGTGAKPKATDTVEVHYTGWLADGGTLFDSSHGRGETIAFPLRGVIPGWTEGLQLMQEGAAYRFTIPAKLAYGPRGQPPTIPPNATLVFLVELIKVK